MEIKIKKKLQLDCFHRSDFGIITVPDQINFAQILRDNCLNHDFA